MCVNIYLKPDTIRDLILKINQENRRVIFILEYKLQNCSESGWNRRNRDFRSVITT